MVTPTPGSCNTHPIFLQDSRLAANMVWLLASTLHLTCVASVHVFLVGEILPFQYLQLQMTNGYVLLCCSIYQFWRPLLIVND